MQIVDVVIPAYNEGKSIGLVIECIPAGYVRHIVVCDNASDDNTASIAESKGAIVVRTDQKGYGNACLSGIKYLSNLEVKPDIIVFMDGDYSDFPEELIGLVRPISEDNYDLVIGSRALGIRERGSMTIPQTFGNWLATFLIKFLYGYHFTDLGPFRAVRYERLIQMDMMDKNFGWTVEMQVKAAKMGMKCTEVPVNYRRRIGVSKVSGTIRGTVLAGYKILWTIFKLL